MIIKVTTIYYDSHGAQHTRLTNEPMFSDEAAEGVRNWSKVKSKKYLDSIIINEDTNRIIQTTGFSPVRGLFCDRYR